MLFWKNLARSARDRRLIVFAGAGCSIEAEARQSRELALDLLEAYCKSAEDPRYGDHVATRYALYKNLTLCDLPQIGQLSLERVSCDDMLSELTWLRSQATSPEESVRSQVEAILRLSHVAEFVSNDRHVLGSSAKRKLVDMLRVWECPTVPTFFHEVTALLIAEGLVHEVITTNYDCLFETACRKHGHEVGTASDQDEYGETDSPRIIKLHGSVGGYEAATRSRKERIAAGLMLTATEVCRWRHQWAEAVLQDHLRRGFVVLFVGFSGRDLNVIGTLNEIAESLGLTRSTKVDRFFLICHRHLSFVWYQFMVKAIRGFETRRHETVLVGMKASQVAVPLYKNLMVAAFQDVLSSLVEEVWTSVDQTTPATEVATTGAGSRTKWPSRELVDTVIVRGLTNLISHLSRTARASFPRVPISPWQALFGWDWDSPARYIPFREAEAHIRLFTASLTMLARFLEARRVDRSVASYRPYLAGSELVFLEINYRDGSSTSFLMVPVKNLPGESIMVMERGLKVMRSLKDHPVGAQRVMFLCTNWVDQESLEQQLSQMIGVEVVVVHPVRLARGDKEWLWT